MLNLLIYIGVPIVAIIFIIKALKNQKKLKTKIELLDKRISELEGKQKYGI